MISIIKKTKRTEKILASDVTGSYWCKESRGIRLRATQHDAHYSLEFNSATDIDELIDNLEKLKAREA